VQGSKAKEKKEEEDRKEKGTKEEENCARNLHLTKHLAKLPNTS
jgi:hypothetical protein